MIVPLLVVVLVSVTGALCGDHDSAVGWRMTVRERLRRARGALRDGRRVTPTLITWVGG